MRIFFFFNDTATTEIYTLSLHDALPISKMKTHSGAKKRFKLTAKGKIRGRHAFTSHILENKSPKRKRRLGNPDRKSTRLNSSHANISYAVFCLKKKKLFNCITQQTLPQA